MDQSHQSHESHESHQGPPAPASPTAQDTTSAPATTGPAQPAFERTSYRAESLELRRAGLSERAIAAKLGISRSTVHGFIVAEIKATRRELGTNASPMSREELQQKIFSLAPRALSRVSKLVDGRVKPEVQLRASTDILDRAGFAPVQRSITIHAVEEMSRETLLEGIKILLASLTNSPPALVIQCNTSSLPVSNATDSLATDCADSNTDMDIPTDINSKVGLPSSTAPKSETEPEARPIPIPCPQLEEGGVTLKKYSGGPTLENSVQKQVVSSETTPAAPAPSLPQSSA